MPSPSFEINARPIGAGNPTFVVAEMAWAHDGAIEKAKLMVDGAADAGADAINIHLTSLPDYMVPFYGAGPGRVSGGNEVHDIYRYLEKINLGFDQFQEVAEHARKRAIALSVMCNDQPSFAFAAARLAPDMLMIHPSSIHEERLVRAVAGAGKPLVLYTGGLKLGEIERAVEWAVSEGNRKLVLQHGFQSYPTPLEDNRLRGIAVLKQQFGFPVAFADHTDGDDPMAMIVPLLAIAMGADMVEKHITPDRAAKGEDFEAAFGPAEFKTFVQRVRQTETTFGSGHWRGLSERELKYRGVVRKRAVAARSIAKGALLAAGDIAYKRCDVGMFPDEVAALVGHVRLAKDVEINTPIQWDVLQ